MTRTLKSNGYVKTHENDSGADIASGDVIGPVGTGERFRIAKVDIADGDSGAAYEAGVHELAAAETDEWDDGDTLYWDEADENLTDDEDAGTNKAIGTAVGDKANGDTVAKVLLNDTPMPAGY